MHPYQLHVRAALWSLRAALARLAELEDADDDGDRGTLRAWAPSDRRGGSGGSGLDRVVVQAARQNGKTLTMAKLSAEGTLSWLLPGWTLANLPDMAGRADGRMLPWLEEADARLRGVLGMDPDRAPMPGIECPACGTRSLSRRMSAPPAERITVCTCTCTGSGCGCGMPTKAEGVMHAWAS